MELLLRILKTFYSFIVNYFPIILIFISIIIIVVCWKNKVRIKLHTFFKKSFRPARGIFGLYVYCGAQGKGKTYSLIEYLIDNKDKIEVYSNIGDIKGVNYTHYVGFKGLLEIRDKLDNGTLEYDKNKQLVIIYDEVFTELDKGTKLSKPVLDFLCQMRKRKILFLTTAQYWAELPITYRRFCRYQIDCNMFPFLWFGILVKTFRDAEQMKWSNEDQEFIAPITETTITKCRRFVADSYNTFLRISSSKSFAEQNSQNFALEKDKNDNLPNFSR